MLANKKWLQSNQTKGGVLVIYIVCPEKKQYSKASVNTFFGTKKSENRVKLKIVLTEVNIMY